MEHILLETSSRRLANIGDQGVYISFFVGLLRLCRFEFHKENEHLVVRCLLISIAIKGSVISLLMSEL